MLADGDTQGRCIPERSNGHLEARVVETGGFSSLASWGLHLETPVPRHNSHKDGNRFMIRLKAEMLRNGINLNSLPESRSQWGGEDKIKLFAFLPKSSVS